MSLQKHFWLKRIVFIFILFFATFSFLFSQLEIQRLANERSYIHSENARLPSAKALAALFLNYRTFAADLGWIKMVVDYGDQLSVGHKNVNMLHNGFVLSELDPTFKHVYEWVPGAYFANNSDPSIDDILELTKLLERGQDAFPSDGQYSYNIAVNFFEGGKKSESRQVIESDIAIHYLQEALKRTNTPARTALLLEWFENRRNRILNKYENLPFSKPWARWMQFRELTKGRTPNIERLSKFLLSVSDPEVAGIIQDQIKRFSKDSDKELVEQVQNLTQTFDRTYRSDWRSIVNPGIWASLDHFPSYTPPNDRETDSDSTEQP